MRININDCDKHSLSLQDILYQIPVLLSGVIAEPLRTDCNWGGLGKCREGLIYSSFDSVKKHTFKPTNFNVPFIQQDCLEAVLTQKMGLTYNLPSCDCWTENLGLHLPGVIRTGQIAQLCFPKGRGGICTDEVRWAFHCATSNTALKTSKVLPADVKKVLLANSGGTSWQILLSWERPREFRPLLILSELCNLLLVTKANTKRQNRINVGTSSCCFPFSCCISNE